MNFSATTSVRFDPHNTNEQAGLTLLNNGHHFDLSVKKSGANAQFAEWLEGDTGFATVVRILEGEGAKMLKLKEEAEKELRKDIAESASEAFPLVLVAPTLIQGIQTLVQAYGIGPLKVNTILLNWFEHEPTTQRGIREILYGRRIKTAFRLGCNIIVLNLYLQFISASLYCLIHGPRWFINQP